MRLGTCWIASVLVLSACQGSGGAGDGGVPLGGSGGGASLPPRSGIVVDADPSVAPSELARALCAQALECDRAAFGALTQDECAIYFSQPCILLGDVKAEDGLAECLAQVRGLTCEDEGLDFFTMGSACGDASVRARARAAGLQVQTTEGAACGDGIECIGDLSCDSFSGGCGVCTPIPRAGDPCPEDGCWTGYCDAATNRCADRKPDGASCAAQDECENFNCSAAGICKPVVAGDLVCSDDSDCRNKRCVDGECVERAPPGGACESGADCQDGFCEDGICKLSARCALGEVGEPCSFIGCARNLECVDGMCIAGGVAGMPVGTGCETDVQCETGYCGDSLTCEKLPTRRPCDADDQCASGSCASYHCAGGGMCAP